MSEELKPCPFCGKSAETMYEGSKFNGDFYYCRCKACNAKVGNYVSESEVRTAWNRRVQFANPGKSSSQSADTGKMVPLTLEELREHPYRTKPDGGGNDAERPTN